MSGKETKVAQYKCLCVFVSVRYGASAIAIHTLNRNDEKINSISYSTE